MYKSPFTEPTCTGMELTPLFERFQSILKDIGRRLFLQRGAAGNGDARATLRLTWLECVTEEIDLQELIHRVHGIVSDSPDLWHRFCKLVPAYQMPSELIPHDPRPPPTAAPVGRFTISVEILRSHVLPYLSYPSAGRLASTCTFMRACVGPKQLANAVESYMARTYGRFEHFEDRSVKLWTIDEQPVVLHREYTDLLFLGMDFAGRTFVADSSMRFDAFVQERWPFFECQKITRFSFTDMVLAIFNLESSVMCATVYHTFEDDVYMRFYVKGLAFHLINADDSIRALYEYFRCQDTVIGITVKFTLSS